MEKSVEEKLRLELGILNRWGVWVCIVQKIILYDLNGGEDLHRINRV